MPEYLVPPAVFPLFALLSRLSFSPGTLALRELEAHNILQRNKPRIRKVKQRKEAAVKGAREIRGHKCFCRLHTAPVGAAGAGKAPNESDGDGRQRASVPAQTMRTSVPLPARPQRGSARRERVGGTNWCVSSSVFFRLPYSLLHRASGVVPISVLVSPFSFISAPSLAVAYAAVPAYSRPPAASGMTPQPGTIAAPTQVCCSSNLDCARIRQNGRGQWFIGTPYIICGARECDFTSSGAQRAGRTRQRGSFAWNDGAREN
ncbi:hypothetical protein B0H16DRAFT_1456143 [Mycena metata]|uniref:Uncharacterized protein n=1 Tax=Mycena metata TaxID=1033252 RepID=A0AAD7JCB8_9AGAR|nr:hypothetical protein B0H16DRAFT_1456143 [Mycena metata]